MSARSRMMKIALTTCVIGALSASARADQFLQEQTKQELSRVYGTSAETARALTKQLGANIGGAVAAMALEHAGATPASTETGAGLPATLQHDPALHFVFWHAIALNATAHDHMPVAPGVFPITTVHEQFGPPRTSRAMALVHLAMFEAVNALTTDPAHRFKSYANVDRQVPRSGDGATEVEMSAAIDEAAYETLVWLYPALRIVRLPDDQAVGSTVDQPGCGAGGGYNLVQFYLCSLNEAKNGKPESADLYQQAEADGMALARDIVNRLQSARGNDGSAQNEPTFDSGFVTASPPSPDGTYLPQQWQSDPVSGQKVALGAGWGNVKTFSGKPSSAYRRIGFNPFTTYHLVGDGPDYSTTILKNWAGYDAIRKFGGDYRLHSGQINPGDDEMNDAYYVAKFWAYDGTAGLCAPVRLYNQVVDAMLKSDKHLLDKLGLNGMVRLYALVNVTLADAAIAAWESKYYYQVARPVTVIRYRDAHPEADAAKGATPPSGTVEQLWFPLGAQNTNTVQPFNVTPPFPSYPSGHAVFGGALFGIMRQFFPADFGFKFQSDEYNGHNRDVYNFIRCGAPGDEAAGDNKTKFCGAAGRDMTIDCAERENADSRLFMGVHWIFDADDGIVMGNAVAKDDFTNLLTPEQAGGSPPPRPFGIANLDHKDGVSPFEGKKQTCPGVEYPEGLRVAFGYSTQ